MPIIKVTLRETKAQRNIIKAENVETGTRKNDLKIEDVREIKTGGNPVVIFDFVYLADYGLKVPKGKSLGEIEIKGEIVYVGEKEEIENVLKTWKKEKQVTSDLMPVILNAALKKSQVEAIEQADKVGLPSPIPLPSIRPPKQSKSSAA